MYAAVLNTRGKPPRYEQFPEPTAGEGEVVVHVSAAALKPVDRQMAEGTHYASPRDLPAICGIDGVGRLEDGTRVYFGGPRPPYGAMAQRTVVSRQRCFPVGEGADEVLTAALVNPAMSAWLTLTWRARLAPGETVLVLGATGVTGKLAVQIAKLLGAGRVVAAGRNEKRLRSLVEIGADATIRLDNPDHDVTEAFVHEAGDGGFQVIVDYLWGRPTETLLSAISRKEFAAVKSETRLVQVGESAGPTIALPAAVLRSTPLTILGTAGIPPLDILTDALQQVMGRAARGQLGIEVETVPLADIEQAWQRPDQSGHRLVIVV
ncbi:MAG TPA: zinc-binding alcohol dehydrogenase family protein [Candidatus Acidoferrum sp.]|nr:zinc-binding alcohol dehydrogenase family protein [Candidatus Acidoferrum sp.]